VALADAFSGALATRSYFGSSSSFIRALSALGTDCASEAIGRSDSACPEASLTAKKFDHSRSGSDEKENAMKFASREGASARTLAVTAPGWYLVTADDAAHAMNGHTKEHGIRPEATNGGHSQNHAGDRDSASKTTTVSFSRGQEIFGPGRGGGLVYIVRSGCIRHYKALPDGRSINVGLLGPNTVFTQEIDPDGMSSSSSAEALVDSTVSVVAADDLADLIQRAPDLATAVVHGMSRRLSELQTLTEHLLARDTSVRLASTLLSLSRGFGRPTADGLTAITLPMTHQNLANMIGSNRVTVTRKLLELQESGAVRSLGRNSMAVHPGKLLAHAQTATTPDSQFD
jgi:CRP/FNR family transcriptional regulator, cyclic AMP receptor protein